MNLGTEFHTNPPSSEEAIGRVIAEFGRNLPDDYLHFIRKFDGGEGFINDHYVVLWRIEDIAQWSRDYLQHTEFEQNGELLLFGGNGGGEAFGFDWQQDGAVVEGPMIGMERQHLLYCAPTFTEFMRNPTGFTDDR